MKINFAGHELILHHAGVLYWPLESILVVSDVHLEKGSSFARRGYFLPPYDSRESLQRLIKLCETLVCQRLLILGDCLHDNKAYDRLGAEEKKLFHTLEKYDPIWIRGNHDAEFIPEHFEIHDAYEKHGVTFRHEASLNGIAEISGHFHPKIEVQHKGASITRRCFIEDGQKMIMPSFGVYTGGLSVTDPAIISHFPVKPRVYALGENRIFALTQN